MPTAGKFCCLDPEEAMRVLVLGQPRMHAVHWLNIASMEGQTLPHVHSPPGEGRLETDGMEGR